MSDKTVYYRIEGGGGSSLEVKVDAAFVVVTLTDEGDEGPVQTSLTLSPEVWEKVRQIPPVKRGEWP